MCRRSSCYKSLRIFLWFTVAAVVATPITGENRRRQIVIAAREMERKVGQGHSYDLRISFACFLDL